MCRFYSWTTLPPSPSLLACPPAPRSQVVPNEPTPKHARSSKGWPVLTCLTQRRFRWARGGADFIAKKAQLLGGSMARCRFRYYSYSYNHQTTRQSVVPRVRADLAKFVGVVGAVSESGLSPSFSTAVACVRARLTRLEVQRGRTKVAPDPML